MRARPALVLGLAAAGGLALATVPAAWLAAETGTVAGQTPITVTGSAVPLASAGALVILAAAVSLLLASPVIARIVGVLAALLGAAGTAAVVMLLLDPRGALDEAALAATGLPWTGGEVTAHLPAHVAAVALGLGAVAGIVTVLAAGRLGATGQRFERSVATTSHARSMDDWDALGRGEDPSDFDGTLDSEGG